MSDLWNTPEKVATIKADGVNRTIGIWIEESADGDNIFFAGRYEDYDEATDEYEWLELDLLPASNRDEAIYSISVAYQDGLDAWKLRWVDLE